MSTGYVRRWTYDPGNSVLTQIEGVDILDRAPPQSINGVGSGTVNLLGEFENGPFDITTEVTSATQLASVFGGFGYTYNGVVGQNPCARQRFADSAIVPEYWNGNGAVHLTGKRYSRLLITRVDTSVGSVNLTRQANLLGGSLFSYALVTGAHLDVSIDGGSATVVTFTGTAATVNSTAAETYANITAGLQLVLGIDSQPNFTVTFLGSDTTQSAVIARINAYAGFTMASADGGTKLTLTGIQGGTGGQVRVVSGTALAANSGPLNLTVGTTSGGGNVANIAAVMPSEINTVVHTAVATAYVEQLLSGQLRIYRSSSTPSTDSIKIASTSTATAFGFPIGVTDAASTGNAGTIPAGTIVGVPAGNQYVIMQSVNVTATAIVGTTASGAGPYSVKIRPATDDGVTVSTSAAPTTVNAVNALTPILLDSFAVTNPLTVSASLSESAIDAAYTAAIGATLNPDDVSHDINIQLSARQSNSVRLQLKATMQALGDNGGAGVLGRVACVRPPIGTLASVAESSVASPGVGATSYDRIIYNYPGVTQSVPAIATIGIVGGTGFTSTGIVTVGSDGYCASVMSQLNPEENPGQLTAVTGAAIALEPNVNGGNPFSVNDYINFKANGICAPKFTSGTLVFQSGVTSVNPSTYPSLAPIHRRRMADYIQDSLTSALDGFCKKLMTIARQQAATLMIRQFMIGLLSPQNLNQQRIAGFYLDTKTPNIAPAGGIAPTSLGIWRFLLLVTTLPSMDDMVIDSMIGDTVVTTST
jgi:hypothetical protein